MDYCYACRRHLNGAYNCPGCGTPVDELVVPEAGDTSQLPVTGDGETTSADESPPGRAARRADGQSRKGRKGRHGRRRAVFYGVGAVAVAGALTVFTMAALSDSGGGHAPTSPGAGAAPASSDGVSSAPDPDNAGVLPSTPATDGPSGSVSPSPSTVIPASTASTAGSTAPPPSRTTSAKPATTSPTATPSHTATATATSTGSATPSPSQSTCKQVLWWCS